MKIKRNQIIEVIWDDIVSDSRWIGKKAAEEYSPVRCLSIGYFLNQDKKVLRLSSMINQNDSERDVTVIPHGCITKIKKIRG